MENIRCVNSFCGSKANAEEVEFGRAEIESFEMGSIGRRGHNTSISAQVRRLDEIVKTITNEKVGVIKIDVEGAEYFVLEGAKGVISQHQPVILIEFNDWAERSIPGLEVGKAQRFLLNLGYKLYVYSNAGKIVQKIHSPMIDGSAMILALPRDKNSPTNFESL